MIKKILLLLLFATPVAGFGQTGDTTYVLKLLARWDNDSLLSFFGQTYNDIWGWTSDEGREYVILGTLDATYFFDVSDPRNPKLCDVEPGWYPFAIHRDFKTYGNYAYGVADEGFSSLQIFDMSYLPDSVHKVYDKDTLASRTHNIFIEGDRIYFASNKQRTGTHYPMLVASLSNPEDPEFLSVLLAPAAPPEYIFNHVHDVYVVNDTAYCSNGNNGMFIYDYRDAQNPELITAITQYPAKGYNHSSWRTADGKYLVWADENHGNPLKIYDVSDHSSPEFVSIFGSRNHLGSIPHNPFIIGDMVYVSYYHEGLVVFDISNPEEPVLAAKYDTYPKNDRGENPNFRGFEGAWGVYPFFPSGTIAVSDMTNGLFLFKLDTITPARPDAQSISLIQNPIAGNPRFKLEINRNTEVNFAYYDITGRYLGTVTANFVPGIYENQEIPTPGDIANGMYIIRVQANDWAESFKVVKVQ